MASLTDTERADLARARRVLDHPSLAIRLADAVGTPIEALVRRLPGSAQKAIGAGTRKALDRALSVALRTLDGRGGPTPSDRLHRRLVIASGAAGGLAGLPGLVVELPFSLTVMLRSIAEHARAQGEDLSQVASRLECLTVFAYGSRAVSDDAADAGYFAVRAALSKAVSEAAAFVARSGAAAAADRSAPALVQLLARIAQRLGVAVSDKAAAQLLPLVGAAGGAAVNALFMRHYQDTAWAHFTIRRLERLHGTAEVRASWDRAAPALPPARRETS